MKSLSLYEMSNQYIFLVDEMFDEETGELNENAMEKLDNINDSIQVKCANISRMFHSLESTADIIKLEKERLDRREKAFRNQVVRLKEYMKMNMERCDIKKIECPEFTIALQNNPVSLDILDADMIPHEYDKPPVREIDRTRVKDALKNGINVPGAVLSQGTHVRIR